MGYSLRVGAVALAVLVAAAARADPPVTATIASHNFPSYAEEFPQSRPIFPPEQPLPLHAPIPPPAINLGELYREAWRAFDRSGLTTLLEPIELEFEDWAPVLHSPQHFTLPAGVLPHSADAVTNYDFFYNPFPDGTYDEDHRVYDIEVRRAREFARNFFREPLRRALKPITHIHEDSGLRVTAEPFYTNRFGLEVELGKNPRARIRLGEDYKSVRVGKSFLFGNLALSFSEIDGERKVALIFKKQW